MARRTSNFSLAVKTEGGLLPTDFLLSLSNLSKEIDGLEPEQYHLSEREKINEAINRAYSRLQGFWLSFKDALEKLSPDDYATSATKEKWLLPLFDCLGYGRLVSAEAINVGDRQYKPSHIREHVPIHLVGYRVELDKRSTAGGARTSSPHSLVQELLNQSNDHLWAFVSNGRTLRILRDNVSLTRQAFIEFDLESIFEGDGYSDFRLLWLLCHQSRVEGTPPESCWLEKWKDTAQRTGVRVRDQLRLGVEKALEIFGTGFLRHRSNDLLRTKVKNGDVTADEYYRQLLRLIYRLLFLFVTEDKNVLLRADTTTTQRKTYYDYYSTARLRSVAGKRRGTLHEDLWANLSFVFEKLSSDSGCPELGLPALGSFLWSTDATPTFACCRLYNSDLLDGLRHLCFTIESGIRRPVQYGQLESEELGSIYESLLEQIPYLDATSELPNFGLRQTLGSERKTTGSYYTPTSLVNCLLDSALEPVLNRAAKSPSAAEAILNLKICDPACGSGHFLIAASHRVAKRLASVRSGDLEPGPEYTSKALRDVISRCIYGVDVNEMAVELCKVSLWLQSAMPGVPLSFLDHRIKCGNSLLGTTQKLIESGIPDEAFECIEGDSEEFARKVRLENKKQSPGQLSIDYNSERESYAILATQIEDVDALGENTLFEARRKKGKYEEFATCELFQAEKIVLDAWCASFVWPLRPDCVAPVTNNVFTAIRNRPTSINQQVLNEIRRLALDYRFFHWELEFPEIFQRGRNGFDLVLGNPPWEHTEVKDKEWFSSRDSDIANASTDAIRKRMIESLQRTNPELHRQFLEEVRKADSVRHFVRRSGLYPLCGRGRINTYAIFGELMRKLIGSTGNVGCILPSGIATDDTTKYFFQDMLRGGYLRSLYSFENEDLVFPGVHHSTKFCLLTVSGAKISRIDPDIVFFARQVSDLAEESRHFTLSVADVGLLSPNTGTCPIFRSGDDARITRKIHSNVPVLIDETERAVNPWKISFKQGLFNMATGSKHFLSRENLRESKLSGNQIIGPDETYLPLYEGKMVYQFDHRFGTYLGQTEAQARQGKLPESTDEQHSDPDYVVMPRHWVRKSVVEEVIPDRWKHDWLLGWRDITSAITTRTTIVSFVPRHACGDTFLLMFPLVQPVPLIACLAACLNSFVVDYACRQRIGGTHLKYHVFKQLPVLPPDKFSVPCPWESNTLLVDWFVERVIKLVFNAHEMRHFAADLGFTGPVFTWYRNERHQIRCELDAAFFVMYGLSESEVVHVLESFPLVRKKEEQEFGEYKSKRLILSLFAEYQKAPCGVQ